MKSGGYGRIYESYRGPFTLLCSFNDDAQRSATARIRNARLCQINFGQFRGREASEREFDTLVEEARPSRIRCAGRRRLSRAGVPKRSIAGLPPEIQRKAQLYRRPAMSRREGSAQPGEGLDEAAPGAGMTTRQRRSARFLLHPGGNGRIDVACPGQAGRPVLLAERLVIAKQNRSVLDGLEHVLDHLLGVLRRQAVERGFDEFFDRRFGHVMSFRYGLLERPPMGRTAPTSLADASIYTVEARNRRSAAAN